LLLLCACAPPLEKQVRAHFAERDAKLRSYRFSGTTRELGQVGAFEFECRAPNKVKGELKAPTHRTFSFDGAKLFDVDHDAKKFTAFELKLPAEKAALVLSQTFSPFAPEGFRVPLLLQKGVEAKRVEHPRAKEAVELSLSAKDESGGALSIVYVMRWPSMDFLEKRSGNAVLRVDDEQCDEKLGLCFPKKLTNVEGGKDVATTELAGIEVNPDIPNDAFTLTPPQGYAAESHQLVEQ
jgi:outer membrane lipoprotein-sorting protein